MTTPAEINPLLAASTIAPPYQPPASLRFRATAPTYMQRTNGAPTNASQFTISVWVKFGVANTENYICGNYVNNAGNYWYVEFNGSGLCILTWGTTAARQAISVPVFLDYSSWYHMVVVWDSANATPALRYRLYINNVEITSWTNDNRSGITTGNDTWNTSGTTNNVGTVYTPTPGATPMDGYMSDFYNIDGQVLDPSYFGQYDPITGVWGPKEYTGTYGNNGFYLKFNDLTNTTTLGNDSSGNGNNLTTNNFSLTSGPTYDAMLDVPPAYGATSGTQPKGNYCVLNPFGNPNGPITAFSDGNLSWSNSASGGNAPKMVLISTLGVTTGKWYFEQTAGTNSNQKIGFSNPIVNGTAKGSVYFCYNYGGLIESSAGIVVTGTPATYTANDVVGVAFDVGNGTATFYKNGVSQCTISSIPANTWFAYAEADSSSSPSNGSFNFGQQPFQYTPPTGFKSLCTTNLPVPSISNGAAYMQATTWTGTGAALTINNANGSGNNPLGSTFYPDFTWIKSRSNGYSHTLFESIIGPGLILNSNNTVSLQTVPNTLTAFNSNGFTLGTDVGQNQSGGSYVGWQWNAGSGSSTVPTGGTITPTAATINQTSGFSIITYTGTGANDTVPHGLGAAPNFIIVKQTSGDNSWPVYHSSNGPTGALFLEQIASFDTGSNFWNSVSPTSTVFTIGTTGSVNTSGQNYISYCWTPISGYSSFGSWTGNGSTNGPFIYTGFRPRFVLYKLTNTAGSWQIKDTSRDTYNAATNTLYPNLNNSEATDTSISIFSNGFKLNFSNGENANGNTTIYAAFAENPFNYSLAR